MAAPKAAPEPTLEPGSIEELVRIAVLFLRYQGIPQGVLVHDLSAAGMTPSRVAELVGTTPNTVSQQKRKPRPAWPKAA